ncbi:MAG: 5-(carboxyamino)imidazole ribonucleotide mutase [Planctomycetes bacterium]|nr:5-(carboxyamino)imidazole ribonucleotide mutase [Planctomycetota bacterium]
MKKALVGIIMGSKSDLPIVENTLKLLDEFKVGYDVKVLSAHRTPDDVRRYTISAHKRGLKVIIAAAGGAAHLAGVIASHTPLPVIGIPVETKTLRGLDSLLSTVQMPAGVPVATVAVGSAGPKNAAILAVQIIGSNNPTYRKKISAYKKKLAAKVRKTRI